MTQEKGKSLLSRLETGLILVFFFGFIIWAISKCQATRAAYEEEAVEEVVENESDTVATEEIPEPVPLEPLEPKTTDTQKRTSLFITVDSLNMREEPQLSSSVITKLRLDEEVLYMDEMTDFRQELEFDENRTTFEPWLKIQTQDGRVGWVYGAGVSLYKKRLPHSVED